MLQRISLEGIDGSGKTSVAAALVEQLRAEGLKADTYAPYREANELLGEDIYTMWRKKASAIYAIGILHQAMAEREAQAKEEGADILVYDRQWMTAFTEVAGTHPAEHWQYFVPAALLTTAPAVAQRRIRGDEAAEWTTLDAQNGYATKYGRLAMQYPDRMLGIYRSDEDVTPQSLARNIIWDMNIRR